MGAEVVEHHGLGLEHLGALVANRKVSTLQMVASIEGKDGSLIPINILPDTGSTHNILDLKAAQRAGLVGSKCFYRVTGHGGKVTQHQAIRGEMVLVNPKDVTCKVRVGFYAYENPCGLLYPENWRKLKAGWPHLKALDIPEPVANQPVEMILGCANLELFEGLKPSRVRGEGNPIARFTRLGWMVGGRTFPDVSEEVEGVAHGAVGNVQEAEVTRF